MIQIKRTYDPPSRSDGRRFLVERLWPRGMKKAALVADAWMKEVAPTTELRQWFDHRVERWDEFQRRYQAELDTNPASWEPILDAARDGTVTLLYSAHDTLHNSAVVLRDYLLERTRSARSKPAGQSPRRWSSTSSPVVRAAASPNSNTTRAISPVKR
jgi:uncharacterized protein YeaO (DUF488 family)